MQFTTLEDIHISQVREIEFEKDLLALKEAELYQKQYLSQELETIDRSFQKRVSELQSERRIRRSAFINGTRIRKSQVKHQLCQQLWLEVERRLKQIADSGDEQYQLILLNYLVEGCIAMFQEELKVYVLEKDAAQVQILLHEAKRCYESFLIDTMGREIPLRLQIAENDYLQPRQVGREQEERGSEQTGVRRSLGGIVLSDSTGNIVFKNTFDARISILKETSLPFISKSIWGSETPAEWHQNRFTSAKQCQLK